MKKHIIIPLSICLALILLSGLYILNVYRAQLEARKEMMIMYSSQTKTHLELLKSRISELPHIVKPFINDINPLNLNIVEEYSENILALEQFYIDNDYFIREITAYNMSSDVFNIYREDNQSIIDVFKARTSSILISERRLVVGDKFSIVIPVYHGDVLVGNVAVSLDIVSMIQVLFDSLVDNNDVFFTILFDEQLSMTLPLTDEWTLLDKEKISEHVCEQKFGVSHGVIKSPNSFFEVLFYYENLMIPEHCIGIAFSANISTIRHSSIIAFAITAVILLSLTIVLSIILYRMEIRNKKNLLEKTQKVEFLQSISRSLPIGIIVNRDNCFFACNDCFISLFGDYVSLNDVGKRMNQLNLPYYLKNKNEKDFEFNDWDVVKFERKGKEISLGRRHSSLKLHGSNYAIDMFWDITEMERLLKDTIQSAITKSELLSRVGGNVKNTLNNVRNIVALLLQQFPDDLYIAHIEQLTSDLYVMLNDVQDYADIEAGLMEFEEVPFNLKDEIKKLTSKHLPKIEAKGIDLQVHVASSTICDLVGDPLHFRQILNELLSNAIKFTQKGSIRISTESTVLQDRNVLIKCTVEDTGVGIVREKLKKFFSFDLRTIKEGDEIGLGVIIIKKLVNIMGGTMRVASPSPISTDPTAPGAQFTFTFVSLSGKHIDKQLDYSSIVSFQDINVLLVTTQAKQTQFLSNFFNSKNIHSDIFICQRETVELLINKLVIDRNRYQIVIISAEITELGFSIAELLNKRGLTKNCLYIFIATHQQKGNYVKAKSLNMDYCFVKSDDLSVFDSVISTHFPNLSTVHILSEHQNRDFNILIVEKDVLSQQVARAMFQNLGYNVDFATDALNMMDNLENKKYDIIFINFQYIDGFEISEKLLEKNYKIPVIAMISSKTKEIRKRIAESGMNGFITKPLNLDSIKDILKKHVR